MCSRTEPLSGRLPAGSGKTDGSFRTGSFCPSSLGSGDGPFCRPFFPSSSDVLLSLRGLQIPAALCTRMKISFSRRTCRKQKLPPRESSAPRHDDFHTFRQAPSSAPRLPFSCPLSQVALRTSVLCRWQTLSKTPRHALHSLSRSARPCADALPSAAFPPTHLLSRPADAPLSVSCLCPCPAPAGGE